jgi:hypothetical protein
MGHGKWDDTVYASTKTLNAKMGKSAFDYSDRVARGSASGVASALDPMKVAGPTSAVAGKNIRESRDSADHPTTLPIIIAFDVTGSMGQIPRVMQTKLPKFMDTLVAKTGLNDAQICYMAIGDAYSDRYPVQIGHFESDNRADEHLAQIIIESGGGGSGEESYELALYAAARKTATDAWEKRGKKGYLITIGDEMAYPALNPAVVKKHFGDDIGEDITLAAIVKEVKDRWEWFHIRPTNASQGRDARTDTFWRNLLEERVLPIEDESLICEVIAGLVSMIEGNKTADAVVDSLGLSGSAAKAVKGALVPVNSASAPAHVGTGNVPVVGGSGSSGMTPL